MQKQGLDVFLGFAVYSDPNKVWFASFGSAGYSEVDMMCAWYKFVNFGASNNFALQQRGLGVLRGFAVHSDPTNVPPPREFGFQSAGCMVYGTECRVQGVML